MLRMLRSTGSTASSSSLLPHLADVATVEQLVAARSQLLRSVQGGHTDVGSKAGYDACAAFLGSLETAAQGLRLVAAPRTYRAAFSASYRLLFPGSARHYRVDVLEASADARSDIWVNGDRFELSAEAVGRADLLQTSWASFGALLDRWSSNPETDGAAVGELATALANLDTTWANFEQQYVAELMEIEEQARKLLVQAVHEERELQHLESVGATGKPYQEARARLVSSISRLNSVANCRRKGRDDLGSDILVSAAAVLDGNGPCKASRAARVLAADVVGSFEAVRKYIKEVGQCLEKVDPHLCNNAGLVALLVDWEERWEVGARYVRKAPILAAISDLVEEIRAAQRVAPALTTMCEDRDAELFLVLPRLVCLCFAAGPSKARAGLLQSLLPMRFGLAEGRSEGPTADPELQGLVERFRKAVLLLVAARCHDQDSRVATSIAEAAAWRQLLHRAIVGATPAEGGQAASQCRGPHGATARQAVEDLMRDLERWSLELQRRCPEDWNQCSAVLVQCLTGESQRQLAGDFQV
mmetsp:Transcript_100905/g.245349  ORF Transcript_100905/g.245349 Transcript_100905/m.245349 type:complete len:530 (+) Transcript_100905:43-1632(+)